MVDLNVRTSGAKPVKTNTAATSRRTRFVIGAIMFVVFALLAWSLQSLLTTKPGKPKQVVHSISLLPPPPPPKIEEKPPEPEVKEEIKLSEPQPTDQTADEPPAGEELGVDADAQAGTDGFALKANKGGRGLTNSGDRNAWYAKQIKTSLERILEKSKKARNASYTVQVRLWFTPLGDIQRYELVESSGDAALDANIKSAIGSLGRLEEPLPADIPQPVRLRIVSRR